MHDALGRRLIFKEWFDETLDVTEILSCLRWKLPTASDAALWIDAVFQHRLFGDPTFVADRRGTDIWNRARRMRGFTK